MSDGSYHGAFVTMEPMRRIVFDESEYDFEAAALDLSYAEGVDRATIRGRHSDADLPNMPPLSAGSLEDAISSLDAGTAVLDPADPANAMAAAETGRAR